MLNCVLRCRILTAWTCGRPEQRLLIGLSYNLPCGNRLVQSTREVPDSLALTLPRNCFTFYSSSVLRHDFYFYNRLAYERME